MNTFAKIFIMIKNIQNSQKMGMPFDAWMIQSDENLALVHSYFKPGEGIPSHPNDDRAIFYVLSGEATLSFEGEDKTLKAGDSVLIPEKTQRGWRNDSNEELSLLVMKLKPA